MLKLGRVQKGPPFVTIRNQMNPVHTLQSYVFKEYFNVVLPSKTTRLKSF